MPESNQPPSAENLAWIGKRLKAFGYDYLVILVYILIMGSVNFGLILAAGTLDQVSPFFASTIGKDLVAFLSLILPVILYFTIGESSAKQATWGKRKAGLQVIDEKGGRLSFGKALLRSGLKFFPWQAAHTGVYQTVAIKGESLVGTVGIVLAYLLVGIFLACIWLRKDHRAPYDWASGSYVVNRPEG